MTGEEVIEAVQAQILCARQQGERPIVITLGQYQKAALTEYADTYGVYQIAKPGVRPELLGLPISWTYRKCVIYIELEGELTNEQNIHYRRIT